MRATLAAVMLGLLTIGACNPGAQPVVASQVEPQPQAVRTEIVAACGGGETDLGPDPVFAADVRRQLNMIGFAEVSFSETGNMTCSLRVGEHNVSWSQGDARAPSGVVDVFELVFAADGRE